MAEILLHEIMEKRFHEIRKKFKNISIKNNIVFDDDIFIDTYIKCNDILKGKKMTENEIINYFWVSFLNNIKKEYRKNKINKIELSENDDETYGIIDEPYDGRRCKIFDIIIKYVKDNFSENEYNAWYLHFIENKNYEELNKLNYNFNLHNTFRNINNQIKNKLPKENKEYNSIIKEIFRKKA